MYTSDGRLQKILLYRKIHTAGLVPCNPQPPWTVQRDRAFSLQILMFRPFLHPFLFLQLLFIPSGGASAMQLSMHGNCLYMDSYITGASPEGTKSSHRQSIGIQRLCRGLKWVLNSDYGSCLSLAQTVSHTTRCCDCCCSTYGSATWGDLFPAGTVVLK